MPNKTYPFAPFLRTPRFRFACAALAGLSLAACASTPTTLRTAVTPPQAQDSYFLAGQARAGDLDTGKRAKNVILFVGDGMSVATVTAARIFAGQRAGRDGESNLLAVDRFPQVALSRTYSHDAQIAESAATATAMVSGVKTSAGGLGLTQAARRNQCADTQANRALSLWAIAEEQGLATGVVSTARLTHATPAATFAHAVNRNWENDLQVVRDRGLPCTDIARQLVEWPHGDGLEVALGGGRSNFLVSGAADPLVADARGARGDRRDLTQEWAAKPGRALAFTAGQLEALGDARGQQVLGLFNPSHMAYESERVRGPNGEPSLKDMTAFAIRRLQQDPDGFVLMVEGGRIDHAHHDGAAGQALSETVALDEAIQTALAMTSRADTLIIVTADHSHAFAIAGYARRGTDILGLSTDMDGKPVMADDGKPYTTLGYLNGPGAVRGARPDLTGVDTTSLAYRQQALVPLGSETHAGDDVAIYAWGPNDAAFRGTLEQHVIFHLMARSLGFSR